MSKGMRRIFESLCVGGGKVFLCDQKQPIIIVNLRTAAIVFSTIVELFLKGHKLWTGCLLLMEKFGG